MLEQDEDNNMVNRDEVNEDSETNVTDRDDDIDFPVDKGWAWAVLAGATLQLFLYGGLLKSYGIFFVEFQRHFNSSASETNVMQTTHFIVTSISGVLVPNLGLQYMSHRTSVVTGGVGMFTAYLISAFTTDIRLMTLTIGVIAGICQMMMFLPLVAAIGIHFRKYRGIANSIHVSGSSIGALVCGPLYTVLFEYYGYSGTMMLVSSIMLNSVISGTLIRPLMLLLSKQRNLKISSDTNNSNSGEKDIGPPSPVSANKPPEITDIEFDAIDNYEVNEQNFKQLQKTEEMVENGDKIKNVLIAPLKTISATEGRHTLSPLVGRPLINRSSSYDPEKVKDGKYPSPLLTRIIPQTRKRARTVSEMSHSSAISNVLQSIAQSKVALYASTEVMCDFSSLGQVSAKEFSGKTVVECNGNHIGQSSRSKKTKKKCTENISVFLQSVFNVSVFNRVFIHYLCMAGMAMPGPIMMNVYLIPYAKQIGATSNDVSVIFIVVSTVDLLCRVLTGIMADRKLLKPTTIVGIACVILGILCQIIRYCRSFWSLVIFSIIQGAFNGCYMCLYNVILIEHMGLETFKHCIGFNAMCHGVATAVFFQLTGLLRDVSGNFLYTYYFIGALLLLGGLLSFTLPVTSSLQKKQNAGILSDD